MTRPIFRPFHKKYTFSAVAIFLAIASFLLLAKFRPACLVVEIPGTGEIAWSAPLNSDEQFQLRYIHSVDLLPVFETYTSKGTQLVLLETRFLSWGAGLGYMQEGTLCGEKGWTIIKNMQRRIGKIPLRVGTIAEHTLIYRGEEIRLRDFLPAQILVHIGVKKPIPYFKSLREAKR